MVVELVKLKKFIRWPSGVRDAGDIILGNS